MVYLFYMSKKHFLYLVFGCILFSFVYTPSQLYFLSDDWDSLLFSLQPSHIFHSFRPLADGSLYVDYSIWKLNATGFHITNLALHFFCAFCFYFFSKIIFSLRNTAVHSADMALAAGFLFLFYPFHSEALFWIVGRGAVLCTMFGLLCFIFYLKKETNRFYYSISLVCFSASLLSYEQAWIIPVIITLFTIFYISKKNKKNFFPVTGFWLLFLVYLTGRFWFTKNVIGSPYGSQRIMNFDIFLLGKNGAAFFFRSLTPPMQSSLAFSITSIILTVCVVLFFFIIRKKINFVMFGSAACFLLSLVPVITLGIDTHDTESERFLYLPSVFLIAILVQFFDLLLAKKTWLVYAALVIENFALWQSYQSFVLSSHVSLTTIQALSETGKTDTIFCKRLPDQYKGAFIFRNGFESAVQLIKKNSFQHVNILSRSELYHPEKTYKSVFLKTDATQKSRNVVFEWKEDKVIIQN